MANRQLTKEELGQLFSPLLEEVRSKLVALSAEDDELLWALRRKLFKELTYDERGKPTQRKKLKAEKRAEQDNKCAVCEASLPAKYTVLDRIGVHESRHGDAVPFQDEVLLVDVDSFNDRAEVVAGFGESNTMDRSCAFAFQGRPSLRLINVDHCQCSN